MQPRVMRLIVIVLLGLLGIDWATGYAIAAHVIQHGVKPFGYALWQVCGPFLILLIIQLFRRDGLFRAKHISYYLFCALFGIVIPNVLVYFASQYIASGILTVLANITPILIYVFAVMFGQEKFNLIRVMAVIIGIIGVLLILHPSVSFLTSIKEVWLYVALLIPVCYAFAIVFIARFRPEGSSLLNNSMYMLLFASFFITPVALTRGDFYPLSISDFNSQLIILEILLSSIGYVLLFFVIKLVGPVYYTITNTVAAITGVIYGHVIFGQFFNSQIYLAIAIIVIAISILTFTQSGIDNAV